jgi:hypothetical protein
MPITLIFILFTHPQRLGSLAAYAIIDCLDSGRTSYAKLARNDEPPTTSERAQCFGHEYQSGTSASLPKYLCVGFVELQRGRNISADVCSRPEIPNSHAQPSCQDPSATEPMTTPIVRNREETWRGTSRETTQNSMLFLLNSGILLASPHASFYFDKGKPIESLGRKVTGLNPKTDTVFEDRGLGTW